MPKYDEVEFIVRLYFILIFLGLRIVIKSNVVEMIVELNRGHIPPG